MTLADFIEANREKLIECWKAEVELRLAPKMEESQLINELPLVIDDLINNLRNLPEEWPVLESAEKHGRQRVETGVDIAGLTEEIALIGEVIVGLAYSNQFEIPSHDLQCLIRVIGRATALSVQAYANLRDKQLAHEAAQHFSFMAHEIRNPLSNARLIADILPLIPEQDRQRHYERLQRALLRLSEQVDNSLVQARLYGEPELKIQRAQAAELVDAACDDIAAHLAEKNLVLTREIADFELDVDPKLIISALTNLLSNAVKFTAAGKRIQIRARDHEDHALFEVEDDCGGLPEDMPQRLFQPFVQKSENKSGFGLGLAIVKQAVEAHHGAVRVFNDPGQGCCFVLDLPRRQNRSS
jgi:signal transduction histidine kinase